MNKRMLWIILIVITLSVNSMAVDFMGPPSANLEQAQWNIGFIYSFSEMDLKVSGNGISETLKDVESNRYWVNFGYGQEDW